MQSFLDTYKELKHINNIEDVAYERLFENYLRYNLKGSKKLVDIDSTDQESIAMKIFPAIPGMIYTFINLNDKNLEQLRNLNTGRTREFHDITPILFCTSYNVLQRMIKGLNLNMLPSEERLKFLEAFYQQYKTFFEKIEEKTEYQQEALNKKYIISALTGKNQDMLNRFDAAYNAKFNFAYRSYKLQNLNNYRMLEYEEWRYIPFFNAKNAFKKMSMKKIHETYNDNKNRE